MQGMGGIGKSVLAAALARDREIRRSYPDGILWVAVGQQPDLVKLHRDVSKYLGGQDDFKTVEQGQGILRQLLAQKAVLLVLDDVWNTRDAQAFDVLGARCRALITTRDAGVLHTLHGESVQVSLFTETEAMQLLADAVEVERSALPQEAREVVKECGCLPLAVALCGGMVKKRGGDWGAILQRLKRADLEKIADGKAINEQHQNIWRAMQVSVDILPPDEQRRFAELAVFATDRTVPEAAVRTLWAHTGRLDDLDTTDLIINLFERSLIQLDQKTTPSGKAVERRFRLHDLLYDFATRKAGEPKTLHHTLLDAYRKQCPGGWHTGPDDGYFFQYLCHHLGEADKGDECIELLCDLNFIEAKCKAGLTYELVKDYDVAMHEIPEGRAEREAEQRREEEIRRYTDEIIEYARRWSNARDRHAQDPVKYPMPEPKDIPLPKVIESVRPWTNEEIDADTQRIINNPTRLHKLKVFSQFVNSEAHNFVKYAAHPLFCIQQAYNSANAGSVHDTASKIIENNMGTRTILHNKSSLPPFNPHPGTLHTLEGHTREVSTVSLTPDGRRAVSGSGDSTLRVWDVESGQWLRTLEGHTGSVHAVSLMPNGCRAVSGSRDGTLRVLRVWNVESGQCLRTLEGHTGMVTAVSLTPDGRRAVSGSWDKTLRVWDVESGQCLHTLKGYTGWVEAVSLTPDGRCAVSGSMGELRVWNVESGQCLRTLEGHSEFVSAVSGRIWDGTLPVRDVESLQLCTLEGHTGGVGAVSLTPDGRCAVSGSSDKMQRVWDVESGQWLRTLEGHTGSVKAVGLTPDGRRAVSDGELGQDASGMGRGVREVLSNDSIICTHWYKCYKIPAVYHISFAHRSFVW
ncbi:MAG: NB-ARC domain-containing protein [Candidatus Brocadiaceae bacterium]|nr:NB-ARC domain-containing protein [Candidatus Brocadiaceae bacterium]